MNSGERSTPPTAKPDTAGQPAPTVPPSATVGSWTCREVPGVRGGPAATWKPTPDQATSGWLVYFWASKLVTCIAACLCPAHYFG
jgi:hypothetical protein